ncbi:sugar ABC transporter ATP-binding protein [Pantoea dispersa]|nr:sugar ABC transporter ATP-binding protein [Pantoea dispersa]
MINKTVRLQLRQISKAFDGIPALQAVSLDVHAGEVHGLIGHNGAGKSTLIKVLGGIHAADEGSVTLEGRLLVLTSPAQAQQQGIAIVHQERLLPGTLTVAEALLLGNEPRIGSTPFIDRRRMRQQARQLLQQHFDLQIDPDALIAGLSVAEQQLVQICRVLQRAPRVVVLDEPTAALARHEVQALFRVIERMRQQGIALIYVSHYLDEIQALCQRVTVLRDGKDVAHFTGDALSPQALINAMIGETQQAIAPRGLPPDGEPVLTVDALSAPGRFHNVCFSARRGEIVGITGLLGSGGKALISALFGLERGVSGTLRVGETHGVPASPHAAVKRGIALVPEDRRANGIALDVSLRDNITLTTVQRLLRWGGVSATAETVLVADNIRQLVIRTPGQLAPLRQLSGGNQQKAVLAKWLNTHATLYLLDEPTVGVDIAAKAAIYQTLQQLAAAGAVIILFSTDLLELQTLADRIIVLARGEQVATLSARHTSHQEILSLASGTGALTEQIL